jgi:hypothetical protein
MCGAWCVTVWFQISSDSGAEAFGGAGQRMPCCCLRCRGASSLSRTAAAAAHVLQVACVDQMRQLNAAATDAASGADLLRFARARKCNAAAAVQVPLLCVSVTIAFAKDRD